MAPNSYTRTVSCVHIKWKRECSSCPGPRVIYLYLGRFNIRHRITRPARKTIPIDITCVKCPIPGAREWETKRNFKEIKWKRHDSSQEIREAEAKRLDAWQPKDFKRSLVKNCKLCFSIQYPFFDSRRSEDQPYI